MDTVRIVVADDNLQLRNMITEYLGEQSGMEVVGAAANGLEAIELVQEQLPDVLICDMIMPKMDGYTATREIRTLNDNKKANIPIIAMTANAFDEDRKKAFEAGMNGFVAKPINIKDLMNTLENIL